MVDVSAAVIVREGKILICQRPEGKGNALLWEFPGGKRETGETFEECLIRECREELGITICVHEMLGEAEHTYPDITVHLRFFRASLPAGEPTRREHRDMRWVSATELAFFAFCPADKEFVARLETMPIA